ncbi:hypothetical protein WJX77_008099 [Trebouxia sp. C0004]
MSRVAGVFGGVGERVWIGVAGDGSVGGDSGQGLCGGDGRGWWVWVVGLGWVDGGGWGGVLGGVVGWELGAC